MGRREIYGQNRKKKIIEYINEYNRQHGYSPSIREITKELGINSTSLTIYYIQALENAGYITRDKKISRSIRVLQSWGD